MKCHLSILFQHINSYFISKMNFDVINVTLYLITENSFVNPINFRKQIYKY